MKGRLSYPLLFIIPCIAISLTAAFLAGGATGGVLWIFVYGDNPWPKAAEMIMVTVASIIAITAFSSLISLCYFFGKKREPAGGLTMRHGLIALAANALAILVCLHEWQNSPAFD